MHRLPQFLAVLAIAVLAIAVLAAPEARAHHVPVNSGSSGFDGWCKENYTYSEIRNVNNLYGGSGGRRQRACKIPNTYRTVNYEYCLHKPFPGDYGAEIFVYDLSGVTPIPVNPLNNAADHPLCEEVIPDSETARKLAAKFTASNRADANRPGPITRVTLVPGGIEIGGWTPPAPPAAGTWTHYRIIRYHPNPNPTNNNVVNVSVARTTELENTLLDNGANVSLVEGRTYWYRVAAVSPDEVSDLSVYDDSLSVTYRKLGSAVNYAHIPATGEGGGLTASIPSGQATLHGATVTFTAAPAAGWTLAAWEGDVENCAAPDLECVLTAKTDLRVTARFARIIVAVEYEAVPPDGGNLTAPVPAGGMTVQGATVTFTAAPAAGRTLAAWEGDVESCAAPALECVLIAGADLRVTAHFARIVAVVEYAEFPADKSGGTLTASVPSGGTTLLGATVVFTAAPAAGWYVEDWEGGGTADCSGLECAVTVVSDAAVLVTVHFAEAAVVRVETAGEPPRGGALSAELPGTGFAFLGATVTFTAAPAAEWYVTGWNNGGCADIGAAATPGEEKQCVLTADKDLLVTVNFAVARAVVYDETEVSARRTDADGGAAVASGETVADGKTIVFLAAPPENHAVAWWTNNNAKICAGQNPCAVAADADLSVRAEFASLLRTIAYAEIPDDKSGGTLTASVPSGGTLLLGATVTFTAAPAAGWYAKEWTGEGGGCAGSRGTCALTVAAGLFVTVRFAADCPGAQIVRDGACACAAGLVFADNDATCLPPADAALVEEVYRSRPVLATIRALLDGNANPNLTLANGAPLVFAAATLKHDQVMSVLITAGANPYSTYEFQPGFPVNVLYNILDRRRSGFVNRVVHWGGAATIWAGSPTLDWSPSKGRSESAYNLMADSYLETELRGQFNKVGGYLLDLGAVCPDVILRGGVTGLPFELLCTSRHVCATARDNKIYDCRACPGAPALDGNECVSAMQKCEDAGWAHLAADDSCQVPLIGGDGSEPAGCHLSGVAEPQCAAVFGANLDFPQPALQGGATLRFVFNCDPDGDTGLIPATQNTNGATECSCAASGEEEVRGVCVAAAVIVAAQSCADAGRAVLRDNGGGCAAAITLSGGTLHSRCYFSGGPSPQCADVFGADLAFPPVSAAGPFVYNCDPSASNGLIPATFNTITATECACPDGKGLIGGVCVAAAVTVAAQSCADAGRTVLGDDGGGCAAAITLSGGTLYSRCYFSGGSSPQCADVFGADFPAASIGGPFIYNCDPEDKNGLIPATTNTITATECACPDGKGLIGGVCVAAAVTVAAQSCADAGRTVLGDDGGGCAAAITLSGGTLHSRCYFSGGSSPQCADVFGAALDFPAASAAGPFVYNCDPSASNGLIPATFNTIMATECACPDGKGLIGGVCVAAAVTVAAQSCADAGRTVLGDDGGGCAAAITLSGGTLYSRCYFSGGSSPQCADVFGAALDFPAASAAGPFVYNCDPSASNGLIPATFNTIMATECACAAPGEVEVGGVCVAAAVTVAAQSCADAGRTVLGDGGGGCAAAITLSGGTLYSRCYFSGGLSPQCADVFGADFPAASIGGPFIYNCDPEDKNGLIPATTNTITATECACPDGKGLIGGVCACPSGQGALSDSGDCGVCPMGEDVIGGFCLPGVAMGRCQDAGWRFSAEDGGSCGILLTLAGGAAADKCYLSAAASPQCAEVFGSTVHYFPTLTLAADGATLRFVYNCDPDGDRGGMIPARANTIAATECGCASETSRLRPGACVPEKGDSPDFDGIAQEALCGAFGGTVRIATGGSSGGAGGVGVGGVGGVGGSRVCSGMDANGTFCILDAEEAGGIRAFPCRGLFKHMRSCNLEFNRPALNPFFCGAACPGENQAFGSGCR